MEPIIIAEGLTRHFGTLVAVDHLDLTVYRGEVFGFLGPNGAGKTTTIRLLNGILRPTEGRATVLGFDVATQGDAVRRHTGVLTENPNLYESLTARENLR
ncbi:MAG: ATP-binding cassette domain-containing protein, partial [Chloroflexi bacterium]|nr:ATP-binding cassette domain-containing protein [Chloroflexota bacterium]